MEVKGSFCLPPEQRILFIPNFVDNLGDIATCMKCASYVCDQLKLSRNQVVIATDEPREVAGFNEREFKIISIEEVGQIQNIAMQIIIPLTLQVEALRYLPHQVPTLGLYEYGFGKERFEFKEETKDWLVMESLGLNKAKGELGVLIDPELYQWGFPEGEEKETEGLADIQQLRLVSPTIQETILGKGDFDELVEQFAGRSLLYLGYEHNKGSVTSYIITIANLNQESDKDLVFFIPKIMFYDFMQGNWQSELAKLNVKTLEIASYEGDDKQTTTEVLNEEMGKNVKIIFRQVDHKDFKYVCKASQKESLGTGDNSVTELIAANKSFVHIVGTHKKEFRNQLNKFYSRSVSSERYYSQEAFQIFSNNQQDNYRQLSKKNRQICEEHNAIVNITGLIETLSQKRVQEEDINCSFLEQTTISPKEMNFDTLYIVNSNIIRELEISSYNGTSSKQGWKDSVFKIQNIAMYPKILYLIKREHK